MQNLNIKIYGDYWESFTYSGKLYLITFSNKLIVCDWNKILLDSRQAHPENLIITENILINTYTIKEVDSPFNELAVDIQIVNKKIYVTTDSGLYNCNLNVNKQSINKLWDNPLFSLNSNARGQISLSAGSNGLFEYSNEHEIIGLKSFEKNIFQITESHSTCATYSDYTIYNSSEIAHSELSFFEQGKHFSRKLFKRYSEEEIFGNKSQKSSWIHKNKIYRIKNHNEIEVKSLSKLKQGLSQENKILQFQQWKGEILSGLSTPFATIIECENALVVSFNASSFINIEGDITKWRVFPNSKQYLNDLHVIHDDYLEIYSFYN